MIIDREYYEDIYGGEEIGDFERLNLAAQSLIEFITGRTAEELDYMHEVILKRVCTAICTEIEYLHTLGGINAVNGKVDAQKKSESYAGSYSYTLDDKQIAEVRYTNGIPHAPMVDTLLQPTGLLYAGVDYV